MNNLSKIIILSGVIVYSSPLFSEEFDRGQALYENHCQFCHESWVHSRPKSKINSLSELQRRVSGWSIHTGLNWSREEILDVTDYLSRNFYHLTDQP